MLRKLTIILLLGWVSITYAQEPAAVEEQVVEEEVCETCPLPEEEWTPLTKSLLARMLVGESGWLAEYRKKKGWPRIASCRKDEPCYPNRDWRLQPWVIYYRWQDMRDNIPNLTYAATIQLYSAAMKPHLASKKRMRFARFYNDDKEVRQVYRRRFLQSISWDGSNLLALADRYDRKGEGRYFVEGWEAVREIVEAWGDGEVANECEEARHWDGPGMALPRDGLIKIDCGETLNDYFTTVQARRELRRERREAASTPAG